jgi:hypothetical protein
LDCGSRFLDGDDDFKRANSIEKFVLKSPLLTHCYKDFEGGVINKLFFLPIKDIQMKQILYTGQLRVAMPGEVVKMLGKRLQNSVALLNVAISGARGASLTKNSFRSKKARCPLR